VYRFCTRECRDKEESGDELDIEIEQPRDLLALYGRSAPKNSVSFEELFAAWRSEAESAAAKSSPAEKRKLLELALKARLPESVIHELDGERILLSRPGMGDRVPGRWIPGRGTPLLVVHADGAGAAMASETATAARAAGRPVLAIDAFQTASAAAGRDRSHQHFLTFNLSDDANRVQDILTAIAFLRNAGQPVEVAGLGGAAMWSLFAGAVAPADVTLIGTFNSLEGTDEAFVERLFVPGIQRAGGLAAALELTAGRRENR
jgi:hypothetical protein